MPPAPAPALERSHSAGEVDVDEEASKQHRRSFVGRILRPSFRRSSVAPQVEAVDPRDTDEYNEELVDWLDIIGMSSFILIQPFEAWLTMM